MFGDLQYVNDLDYINGVKEYPNNEIITGVLPSVSDLKEAMSQSKEMRQKAVARLKEQGIDSSEKLVSSSLKIVRLLRKYWQKKPPMRKPLNIKMGNEHCKKCCRSV